MSRRISAIDIGSNAIRMMIVDLDMTSRKFQILKKYRAAVRLGHDVFTQGAITNHTLDIAKATFEKYAETNQKMNVTKCRAVATSACREAQNKQLFMEEIYKSSGIQIEIIDGAEEGRLIHSAVYHELDLNNKKTLLIDIGGGSVEVTFSKSNNLIATQSFPMGTVRILENLRKRNLNESHLNIVMGELLEKMSSHIYTNNDLDPAAFAIGTGGNLECLGKLKVQLLHRSPHTFLTLTELNLIIEKLSTLKLKDRIEKIGLRPDRADVIIPAAMIVQTVMRQAETEKILIPNVGLRDGIIWSML